jgi:hypothetical protein
MARPQKNLKIDQLIAVLRESFQKVKDPRTGVTQIPLDDFLMSSYAVFSLKYPSLFRFEKEFYSGVDQNVRALFDITHLPSDTHLRDVMDLVDPKHMRKIFTSLFAEIQKTKVLKNYEYITINGKSYYLVSLDGTGYFSSEKVYCDQCMRYHEDENDPKPLRFGHNVLAASMVHPDQREVFSFCPEPIQVQDGKTKNDCEINAFKRFIVDFRREHSKLNVIFVLDALYACGPVIALLKEYEIPFIINVKYNKSLLMSQYKEEKSKGFIGSVVEETEFGEKIIKKQELVHRYSNQLRLSQDKEAPPVNFIELDETWSWMDKDGRDHRTKKTFTWVTDISITNENVALLAKGGRARWKIENETFNTLKNQGYYLEHNYGHGQKNLSINMVNMMFTAFLIDQIQQACCHKFRKAFEKHEWRPSYLWNDVTAIVKGWIIGSWDDLFTIIIENRKMVFSTS